MAVTTTGVVTYSGRKALVRMFMDSTAPHALYVAYGTGTTAVSKYDYRMESESKRELGDSITRSGFLLRIISTFPAVTEDISVTEFGVFTAIYGGELIYHAVMASAIELAEATDDQFKIDFQMTIQQGT